MLEIPADCTLICKCPHCKQENFDNGLEIPRKCTKCFNYFIKTQKGVKKLFSFFLNNSL